jgi:hypothetical protein
MSLCPNRLAPRLRCDPAQSSCRDKIAASNGNGEVDSSILSGGTSFCFPNHAAGCVVRIGIGVSRPRSRCSREAAKILLRRRRRSRWPRADNQAVWSNPAPDHFIDRESPWSQHSASIGRPRRCSDVMLLSAASFAIVISRPRWPFTVDVLFELNNDELLITDYALDEIAD